MNIWKNQTYLDTFCWSHLWFPFPNWPNWIKLRHPFGLRMALGPLGIVDVLLDLALPGFHSSGFGLSLSNKPLDSVHLWCGGQRTPRTHCDHQWHVFNLGYQLGHKSQLIWTDPEIGSGGVGSLYRCFCAAFLLLEGQNDQWFELQLLHGCVVPTGSKQTVSRKVASMHCPYPPRLYDFIDDTWWLMMIYMHCLTLIQCDTLVYFLMKVSNWYGPVVYVRMVIHLYYDTNDI